ncbi:hypothetical protein PI23P_09865 [Polaribacter irgensii 23-P]|uniref:Uncharacterized protein n=1 Tax=Polaribacter irgensii 23-P TaxID=313594 RepID=A4C0I2_9FLAO|nr:hypothetical protein [Polaribacter irgensii]EAR12925.1 hypothetical protein PI23P_09865 [Polaribacter irgensii 23-P]
MRERYAKSWNIACAKFADREENLMLFFYIISYGQSRAISNVVRQRGYRTVDCYLIGFVFNGFIKKIPGLYVDLGLNVPIGMEVLKDIAEKKFKNFLIGLCANQGVKLIS